ncbi:MAG: helix-turn-helix domain-containing protein [Pyrodictiaceae archaeon]
MAEESQESLSRKVVEMYNSGVNVRDIASSLGLSMSTIYRILKSSGVKMRRRKYVTRGRVSDEELEKIIRLYLEGKSIYEIAKIVDRPVSTIYYVVKKFGEWRRASTTQTS